MEEITHTSPRNDPRRQLDYLISLSKTDVGFSLIINNCPQATLEKLKHHNINFVLSEKNATTITGDPIETEVYLESLKTLQEISTTRYLELLCQLLKYSDAFKFPEIDNEDIELVIPEHDSPVFILRINPRLWCKRITQKISEFEKVKGYCKSLFVGRFETDETSPTFKASCDYRIIGYPKLILIKGPREGIAGALERLASIHQCMAAQKKDILLKQLFPEKPEHLLFSEKSHSTRIKVL